MQDEKELLQWIKPHLSSMEKEIDPLIQTKLKKAQYLALQKHYQSSDIQNQGNLLLLKNKLWIIVCIIVLFAGITIYSTQQMIQQPTEDEIDSLILADELSPNELLLANKFLH